MRWKEGRRSTNVEDRRGSRVPRAAVGGGLGLVILAVVTLFLGGDPMALLGQLAGELGGAGPGAVAGAERELDPAEEQTADFVAVVLADTEDVWTALFEDVGRTYEFPQLTLFTDAVESACGFQSAAVGPFYCPGDRKVYLDLGFFGELERRHGAPGDFAQAYVIAHEIGHHVQNLLGTSEQVHAAQLRASEEAANDLSVRLELQADFYAGVWAHHAQRMRNVLESGDVEEALNAASMIGDDRLQRETRGYVTPESFTHGTSEQRSRWFRLGLETGDLSQGDTFKARDL